MTHSDLVTLAERWLWGQGCGVVLRELNTTATPETPDAIGFRSGISILVECKTCRSDFLADRRKVFREHPDLGVGAWRFYLAPKGLLTATELPEGWGLIEVNGLRVRRTSGGPKGNMWHSPPFTPNTRAEQGMLYSALRRLALRGRLPEIYEPYPAVARET